MFVQLLAVVILKPAIGLGRDADEAAIVGEKFSQFVRVEGFVTKQPEIVHLSEEAFCGLQVVGLAAGQLQTNRSAIVIDQRGQFAIQSSFGFTHGLGGLSSHGIGSVLVDFYVATIHTANRPDCPGCQALKYSLP